MEKKISSYQKLKMQIAQLQKEKYELEEFILKPMEQYTMNDHHFKQKIKLEHQIEKMVWM